VEFIKFVLNKRWLNKKYIPDVKSFNCDDYFEKSYKTLSRTTKRKLDYVKRYINCDEIKLFGISHKTNKDGDKKFYRDKLLTWSKNIH
jgi:hypothetical protein